MQTINQILDLFSAFRMPEVPGDEYATKGRQALADKISPMVAAQQPLRFVMLGFPMKSPNDRDKVLGKLPDLAEQVAMENFKRFSDTVQQVYAPGIDLKIVSDGYIFSDIMGEPDSVVAGYNEMARDMARIAPITWYEMPDFYDRNMPMPAMRRKAMEQWGITPEELERRILLDPDVNSLYKGMIRFLQLDLAIRNFPSGNQLHKEAKKVAREMMFRNEAYSALIRNNFADHIRLSMHPSINNGTKYSFQLIPSPEAFTSPWHCALLLRRSGIMATIHRKDAVAAGYELQNKDGRPYYFTEN